MKGAKGLELPINMIIVIAIAVLVLVVISAFFAGQTGRGFNTIQFENAFNTACTTWRSTYNCGDAGFTAVASSFSFPGQPSTASLQQLCAYKLRGIYTDTSADATLCRPACGCAVSP